MEDNVQILALILLACLVVATACDFYKEVRRDRIYDWQKDKDSGL